MSAPFLDPNASLDAVRDDLVYLRHRLSRDPLTHDLAKLVAPLITENGAVRDKQLARWDAQTEAQGDISIADEALDVRVDAVDNDLRVVVNGDREDPRYRLYIAGGVYELKRPVLGEELETLRDWETNLEHDEAPTLRAHRKGLSQEIAAADAAVKARDVADAANAAFRATGDLAKYVQKVAATRDRVWAELEARRVKAPQRTLPRDWPDRFFKPRAQPTLSEAERTARAAERARLRDERTALAAKRKELAGKLRDTKKELASLGKKPRAKKA